jgi:hypothetical protein
MYFIKLYTILYDSCFGFGFKDEQNDDYSIG